jgi:hypothetical protein
MNKKIKLSLLLCNIAILTSALHAQCGPNNSTRSEYVTGASGDGVNFGTGKEDIFTSGYANGDLTTNTNPAFVRTGPESIKHALWGPDATNETGKRAEITMTSYVEPVIDAATGQRYTFWYGWSYFIPNDSKWSDPALEQFIGQWRYSNLSGCQNNLTCNNTYIGGSGHHIMYQNGRMTLTLTVNDNACSTLPDRLRQVKFDLGAAAKGVWMDFIVQVKWTSANDGVLKVWIQRNNGGYVPTVDYVGVTWTRYANVPACTGYNDKGDTVAPNWQIGMYYSNDKPLITDPRVLYSDNISLHRTLCTDSVGSEGWNETLPAPGNVVAANLGASYATNPVTFDKPTETSSPNKITPGTNGSVSLVYDDDSTRFGYAKLVGTALNTTFDATIAAPLTGTYSLSVRSRKDSTYAIANLLVNGTSVSSTDLYTTTSPGFFEEKVFPNIRLNAGSNTFRWVLTGKTGPAFVSGGVTKWLYTLDAMTMNYSLTPGGGGSAQTITRELESASFSISVGDTLTIFNDALASGGAARKFEANAINDSAQTGSVIVTTPGFYNVKLTAKKFTSRGIATLYINNVAIGSWDQYSTLANDWATKDFGNVSLNAGGNAFKWVITGKNASSTGYDYTLDKITLTP